MGKDHTIVLSSLANLDLHPSNSAGSFTNILQHPISLNPNKEYEVALMDVFLPREIYPIKAFDKDCTLSISVYHVYDEYYRYCIYQPKKGLMTGDIPFIVNSINEDITREIQIIDDAYIAQGKEHLVLKKYIHPSGMFYYDEELNRITLNLMKGPKCNTICSIKVSFSDRLGSLLGYDGNTNYQIYNADEELDRIITLGRFITPHPPNETAGLDYIIINSDIVSRTPFGGQLVNVLDIISFDPNKTRSYRGLVYYKLEKKEISDISIKLSDQNGGNIAFRSRTSSICVLHIREVQSV